MRVFLSYHTPDLDLARALEAGLLGRRPDLTIYLAPRALSAGAYWLPKLAEEIGRSDAVLFLAGNRIGPWQELEYYEAMNRSRQRDSLGRPRILPVVTGERAPGLPFFALLHQVWTPQPASPEGIDAVLAGLAEAGGGVSADPPWRRFQPYKGLAALTEQDTAFFFGREAETDAILTTLAARPDRIVSLIGASGVGKSSLARAGVLAALQSQIAPLQGRAWPAALSESRRFLPLVLRPGDEPLRELALACAKLYAGRSFEIDSETAGWATRFAAGGRFRDLLRTTRERIGETLRVEAPRRFVLYVDQAEELYTRAPPEASAAFSRLLAEAAGLEDVSVLLSLRADYYAAFQNDADLFAQAERLDVLPMDRAALIEAIRRPALSLGARFEDDAMVARIAEAVVSEPGALPLLSDYMHEMWLAMQARGEGVLRWPDASGLVGVSAPLNRRAEAFLALPGTDAVAVRRLFSLRLTQVPPVGEPVRRVGRRGECGEAEWRVAEALAGEEWRLLILSTRADTGEACAEVAHEQLLRRWPRLAAWLDEERAFLAWKGSVEQAAAQYALTPAEERPDAVLMGRALAVARGWFQSRPEDLSPEVSAFLAASIARDEAAARARDAAEHRLMQAELAAERYARERAEADREAAETRLRRARTRFATAAAACLVVLGAGAAGTLGWRELHHLRDDRAAADAMLSALIPVRGTIKASAAGEAPGAGGAPEGAGRASDPRDGDGAKLDRVLSLVGAHPANRQLLIVAQFLLSERARAAQERAEPSAESQVELTALAARRVALARSAEAAGSDATSRSVLGNSLVAKGDLDLASDRRDEARAAFAEALATFEGLPADDAGRTRALAVAHQRLGNWAMGAQKTADGMIADAKTADEKTEYAKTEYAASLRLFDELAASAPSDSNAIEDLATQLTNTAIASFDAGETGAALAGLRRAVGLRRDLLARDPASVGARLALGGALFLVAAVASGEPEAAATAEPAAREGRMLAAQLVADAKHTAARAPDLRRSEALLASFDQLQATVADPASAGPAPQ